MIERLKAIQDTYNGLSKEGKDRYIRSFDTDSHLQEEVRVLAKHFLNRTIKGCSWCALGAFLDLLRLNQKDMEQKENSNKLGFQLLAGTLLHDPINKDFSKILTPQSLTDELALYHLALNPRAKEYFSRMPANVDELVNNYIREQSEGALKDAGDVKNRQLNAMQAQLAIMQKAYDNVEASQKERKAEIDALSARIDEIKDEKKSGESPEGDEAGEKDPADEDSPENGEKDPDNESEYLGQVRAKIAEYNAAKMTIEDMVSMFDQDVSENKITKTRIKELIKEVRGSEKE